MLAISGILTVLIKSKTILLIYGGEGGVYHFWSKRVRSPNTGGDKKMVKTYLIAGQECYQGIISDYNEYWHGCFSIFHVSP